MSASGGERMEAYDEAYNDAGDRQSDGPVKNRDAQVEDADSEDTNEEESDDNESYTWNQSGYSFAPSPHSMMQHPLYIAAPSPAVLAVRRRNMELKRQIKYVLFKGICFC